MFSSLYSLTFLASLIALSAWFYYRDNERWCGILQKTFFGAMALFGVSWLLSKGEFSYKMIVLGRELFILAIVPVVLSLFRKIKWAYIILLLVTAGLVRQYYKNYLATTFPQSTSKSLKGDLDTAGEFLIEVREGHSINDIRNVLNKFNLTAERAFFPKDAAFTDLDDYYVINVPPKFEYSLGSVKKALSAAANVDWVEDNEQITLSPIEIEPQRTLPRLNKKYGLNDPGLENLWGFEEMKVNELYEVLKNLKPKTKARIAILDTGVDGNHEDIQANFVSTQSQYDYDKLGHGTHCAGIAAAVSNNGRGIASFSQNNEFVQVTSVKVLSDNGFGTQRMIIQGMLEAADAGADVLSLSLGGRSSDPKQRAYQQAIEYAKRKGAIVVVAAGNSNMNARGFAPANVAGVITVSAVDTLLGKASFSNTVGDLKMAVAAPGVKIYSTIPGSKYTAFNGTSMATPYVSGLVGLMKSLKPELTAKEAFEILKKTGIETKGKAETGKLIQPAAAVRELMNFYK